MGWTNNGGMYVLDDELPRPQQPQGLLGSLGSDDKMLALGLLSMGMLAGNQGRTRSEAFSNALQGGMQSGVGGLNMALQNQARQKQLGLQERGVRVQERGANNAEEMSALQRAMLEEQIAARRQFTSAVPGFLSSLTGGGAQAPAPSRTLGGGLQPRVSVEGLNPIGAGDQGIRAPIGPTESAGVQGNPALGGLDTMGGPRPVINPQYSPALALALSRGPEGLGTITELMKMSKPGALQQIDRGSHIDIIDTDTRRLLASVPKEQSPDSAARLRWDQYTHGNLSANQQNDSTLARWNALRQASADSARIGIDQQRLRLDTPVGMNMGGGGISMPPLPPMVGLGGQGQGPQMGAAPAAQPIGGGAVGPAPVRQSAPPMMAQSPLATALAPRPNQEQIPFGVSPKDFSQARSRGEGEFSKGVGEGADNLLKGAESARSMLSSVGAIRQSYQALLANKGDVGALANLQMNAGAALQAFGINPASLGLPKDAGPFQVIDALTNRMSVSMIGPGGIPANNFSEADRKFAVSMMSGKTDTPYAFNQKLEIIEKLSQRGVEAEQFLLRRRAEGATLEQIRSEWSKHVQANPLFPQPGPSGVPSDKQQRRGVWQNGRIVYQ